MEPGLFRTSRLQSPSRLRRISTIVLVLKQGARESLPSFVLESSQEVHSWRLSNWAFRPWLPATN
jgi:hypothetical protein